MTETLNRDFDEFLFSRLGTDATGMPLTVMTALARLNLDPWDEAAALVRLPFEPAAARLAGLIAGVPMAGSQDQDPPATAGRLVKLLQDPPVKRARPSTSAPHRAAEAPAKPAGISVYFLLALAFVVIALWAMALKHPEATPNTAQPQSSSAS